MRYPRMRSGSGAACSPGTGATNGRCPGAGTRDPYAILVSEIMLQQTQVSRVEDYWTRFLAPLPDGRRRWRPPRRTRCTRAGRVSATTPAPATCTPRRSRSSATTAACFPRDPDVAAAAARHRPLHRRGRRQHRVRRRRRRPSTRTSRACSRARFASAGRRRARRARARTWQLANALVPRGRAGDWNQALMDLGATICTARAPRCPVCPVRTACPTAASPAAARRRRPRRK